MSNEHSQQILDRNEQKWGMGGEPAPRYKALRQFVKEFMGNGKVGYRTAAGLARAAMQSGVWAPLPEKVSDELYFETAAEHACGVAKKLQEEDGRTNEITYMSYEKKDEAYRFMRRAMRKLGRKDLLGQWKGTEWRGRYQKTRPDLKPKMMYPDGVDPRELRGVAKLPVFDVCDFMKILDYTQHGERPDLAETEAERYKYRISWEKFEGCIQEAGDLYDLAARVAVTGAKKLLSRGVSEDNIQKVLVEGFAKKGLVDETGQRREARKLVYAVSRMLESDEDLKEIGNGFKKQGLGKISGKS